jgi:hypothetical protein
MQREEFLKRQGLIGPAAVQKELVEQRLAVRRALRVTTKIAERNRLNDLLATINISLRDLRRKRSVPKLHYELDDLTDRGRVMARLAKNLARGRDVIYHGTRHLPDVLRAGKLVPISEFAVSFTRSAEVAAHFATLLGTKIEKRSPGVLVLDRSSLAQCYRIEPSRYDETSSRDEREEAIRFRAVSFRRHLLGVVGDTDVSAMLGPPTTRYLPAGFVRWSAARRTKFTYKKIAAGDKLVRDGRARVRELIIRDREKQSGGRSQLDVRKVSVGGS